MSRTNNPLLGDYVDRDELAKIFNVSPRTITRWCDKVDGLPFVELGNRTLFNIENVRKWLARARARHFAPQGDRRTGGIENEKPAGGKTGGFFRKATPGCDTDRA